MKFIICPDSFKDCMNATRACEIISQAILDILPYAKVKPIPMSDGGQGFISAITTAIPSQTLNAKVQDPLGRYINASYAIINEGKTAVIETAQATGLELLKYEERNPFHTTSYGVGELIRHALQNRDIKEVICGLGGSATNDGGAGMLQALGAELLDGNEKGLQPGGIALKNLAKINLNNLVPELHNISIKIASDVRSPLIGKNGASMVFSRQKGATQDMTIELDDALQNYADKIKESSGIDLSQIKGSGAAGGLGAALLLLNGKMYSGIELIAKYANLEEDIQDADYVFSGEGSIDSQTTEGKTISGIARLCKKHHKPLIILTGYAENDLEKVYTMGVTSIFPINNGASSLKEALANGKQNLYRTAQNIIRLISNKS